MGWLLAAVVLLPTLGPTGSDSPLLCRPLTIPLLVMPEVQPVSFDLLDLREEQRRPASSRGEREPHTIFTIKRHLGVAAGYDNGIAHGSIGLYLTIAEFGRWNFGVPSPEIGFGRYQVYDQKLRQTMVKTQTSIFISLASVHFRGGYLHSLGMNWYVNLEQIFDSRANLTGSQVGVSFSRK